MNPTAIAGLVFLGIGAALIVLGAWMTVIDWKRKLEGKTDAERNALGGTLTGLAKVLRALKGYPTGQRMIIFGFLVALLGGILLGVKGL